MLCDVFGLFGVVMLLILHLLKTNCRKHRIVKLITTHINDSDTVVTTTRNVVTTIVSAVKQPLQFCMLYHTLATLWSQVLQNDCSIDNILPMKECQWMMQVMHHTLNYRIAPMGSIVVAVPVTAALFLVVWTTLELLFILMQLSIPPLDFHRHSLPILSPHPSWIMMPGEIENHFAMTRRQRRCRKKSVYFSHRHCCHYVCHGQLLQNGIRNRSKVARKDRIFRDGGGRNYILPDLFRASTKDSGWESSESKEEYFASIKHRLLGQSWIQFEEFYGRSIDDLMGDDDPTAHIRNLKRVAESLRDGSPLPTRVVHAAPNSITKFYHRISSFFSALSNPYVLFGCVAGFNGFNFLLPIKEQHKRSRPIVVQPNTSYQSVFDSSQLFTYLAGKAEIPVIIDTGASISLTPVITDFVGEIEPADLDSLQGLSSKTKVCGQGIVNWKIQDMFGIVRTVSTKAYYVPDASTRLMSPQRFFQEHKSGHAKFTGTEMDAPVSMMTGISAFPAR